MICYNAMVPLPENPLSLSAGVASRLVLVAVILAVLWGAVAWAMSA